jgi:2-C-methyl-D-erythritol 4-phosphate cytidylyltransferase
MKTFTIIPAGGKGQRFGESLPKQYHQINGKEILVYTLDIFQKCSLVDEIIVPAQKDFITIIENLACKYNITKLNKVVEGGKERQDSVYNALISIDAEDDDLIAVHDVARPLLPEQVLVEAILTAKKFDNIIVCLKASDTLVQGNEFINSYIDRENVLYVQTPQIFRYKTLKEAMVLAKNDDFYGTDESMLVNRLGYKIKIVSGSPLNLKITSPEDIEILTKILT